MFEIRIEQNKAWVLRRETLTAYSEGCEAVRLRLDFDAAWEGLAKIAVFRACDAQIDLALSGDTAQIPPQVLLRPNVHLLLGLYGIRADGAVVIPTVWADLGLIQAAANPCAAENFGKPALELFAQLHKEGTTLIVVTHDPEVADAAQRTIVLEHGKVAREVINENFGK